jgi:nitrous oxidase accessory protein NosD
MFGELLTRFSWGSFLVKTRTLALFCAALACAATARGTVHHVPADFGTIGEAIAGAVPGDTIMVAAGTYDENLIIDKSLTLLGSGQSVTTLVPAFSGPVPDGVGSLPPGSSNIILVQANDVVIRDFTIDGDNTDLTSGVVVSGADIDARNGVITNHSLGVFNGLDVSGCAVKNIYLRGVYASSGGTFNFHDNAVENVQGSTQSIGMFNFGGAGAFSGNSVASCNDAISANHSKGTEFLNNTVTGCGRGIHTDNAGDGGGTADRIEGNEVSSSTATGYGIFVFVPYIAPVVTNNTIRDCAVGLTCAGAYSPVKVEFTQNTIDGMNKANSVGLYVTTQVWGYTSGNVTAILRHNFVINNVYGAVLESEAGFTNSLTLTDNDFSGYSLAAVYKETGTLGAGTFAVDASANWWGSNDPVTVNGAIASGVDYTPWLDTGEDVDPLTPGFQGDHAGLWVDDDSPQTGATGRIQEGVDLVPAITGIVHMAPGSYEEQVEIAKPMGLFGSGASSTTVLSPFLLIKNFVTGSNANKPVIFIHDAEGVSVRGLTVDGQGYGNNNFRFVGIGYSNADGEVDSCSVINIRNYPIDGGQHGIGIYAYRTGTTKGPISIKNTSISGFQKGGIVVNGDYDALIENCSVTGYGPSTFIAQNGIQIGYGGTGRLAGDTVTGVSYTPATYASSGILLQDGTGAVECTGNAVADCQIGINYINTGGRIDSNTVTATPLGTGLTYYWNIVADPNGGSSRQPSPTPFDAPAAGSNSESTAQSPLAITTSASDNTLDGAGIGTGLEADALGSQSLTFSAFRNRISHFTGGLVLSKDPGAVLNATLTSNELIANDLGLSNSTGGYVDATMNTLANTTNADDPIAGNYYDGNCWSDWNGVPPYTVAGAGGNVDNHPGLYGVDIVGDWNADGYRDIGDLTFMSEYLFFDRPPATPLNRGDVTCDDIVDISDLSLVVDWLFDDGPAPCDRNCVY